MGEGRKKSWRTREKKRKIPGSVRCDDDFRDVGRLSQERRGRRTREKEGLGEKEIVAVVLRHCSCVLQCAAQEELGGKGGCLGFRVSLVFFLYKNIKSEYFENNVSKPEEKSDVLPWVRKSVIFNYFGVTKY